MNIDFSIMINEEVAFGYVNGQLDLSVAPMSGDVISLSQSQGGRLIPEGAVLGGQLRVVTRLHNVASAGDLQLSLENMVVTNREAAVRIGEYLEVEFGLYLTTY